MAKEKPVTKDAMKGYRAGDIKTSKLPGSATAKVVGPQEPPRGDAPKSPAKQETPVPGRAIVRAIKNAWSGKGPANPTGVMQEAGRAGGATGTWAKKKKPLGK